MVSCARRRTAPFVTPTYGSQYGYVPPTRSAEESSTGDLQTMPMKGSPDRTSDDHHGVGRDSSTGEDARESFGEGEVVCGEGFMARGVLMGAARSGLVPGGVIYISLSIFFSYGANNHWRF